MNDLVRNKHSTLPIGPFYYHGLTLIQVQIDNHIPSKVQHKYTYPLAHIYKVLYPVTHTGYEIGYARGFFVPGFVLVKLLIDVTPADMGKSTAITPK